VALTLDLAVQQFLDHLKVERELAPATVQAYGQDLAAFSKFVVARGVRDVSQISPTHVLDRWAELLDEQLPRRTPS